MIMQQPQHLIPHKDSQPLIEIIRGETLYQQGDPSQFWYEVISGTVRTCRFYLNGHRQLTGFYFTGDIFGVEPDRYGATAEAVTDLIIRRHPAEGRSFYSRAVHSAHQFIFLLGHRAANERLAAFLLMIACKPERRYHFDLPMSRSDIADHLGLTIHTVSRTFSELVRTGVISLDRRQSVHILNWGALTSLAGEEEQGEFQ